MKIQIILVLIFLEIMSLPYAHAPVTTRTVPRATTPYGFSWNDAYGTITASIGMNMTSWGVCATKPNPSSLFGIPCNNGNTNATFIFNVTGWELAQAFYQFTATGYGNGTIEYVFIGIAPSFVLASTIVQSATYGTGSEKIINSRGGTDLLCVGYAVNSCTASNGGGGGGSSGGSGGGIPGVTSPGLGGFCISCYGFSLLMFAAISSTSLIFIVGAVRRRR